MLGFERSIVLGLDKARSISERIPMLTSQKVVDTINEPAFAKATAWRAEAEVIGLHPRNPR
jgi:hypothetical protein